MNEEFETVRQACAKVVRCAPETLTPATDLRADLGVDSMDATDLAMLLEDETGVKLTDEELWGVRTLGQLAELLAAKTVA